MHQTKKGNQWYFRRKAHIGMDSKNELIHSVAATHANVHDKHAIPATNSGCMAIRPTPAKKS
jgi:transposase, IS5 family